MYELHYDGQIIATAHSERAIYLARRTLTAEAPLRSPAALKGNYDIAYPATHAFPMSDGRTATAADLGLLTTTEV